MERRKFSREFKHEAVNPVRERGMSLAQTNASLGHKSASPLALVVGPCAARAHGNLVVAAG